MWTDRDGTESCDLPVRGFAYHSSSRQNMLASRITADCFGGVFVGLR